ncbi:Ceramide synthase 3 [Kappamyces sp. JEL0680]|nr:Ceramide synthase 3 [Kappamyces sp. JEL0680]
MSDFIKYYYVLEMAGYAYSILIMPFEARQTKADYIAYLIHHSSTLFLMWVSYIYSCHRIGVVITFLHDIADPWMEIAKLTLYSGRQQAADVLFGVFALAFIVTRNIIFPFGVILSIPKYARHPDGTMMPSNGMNYALQVGLWTLECLHCYWGSLIVAMAYKAIVKGKIEDDIRNVDEDSVEAKNK